MKKLILAATLSAWIATAFAVPNEAEQTAAWQAANKVAIHGPGKTLVAGQSEVAIPKGYDFIPKTETAAIMRAMGNGEIHDLQGMLVANSESSKGDFYVIEYHKDGYIKDDDAKDLNPDDILAEYKEGTEAGNKERTAKGFAPIETAGWAQKPSYDPTLHRLTWALILRDKGAAAGPDDTVNYETRILGREGVLAVTWVAGLAQLATDKGRADQLTAGVSYVDGKKYENYSASAGDKVAEYGLAALITGVATKKLGLFAMLAAFLAKFAKVGILAAAGGLFGLKKLFKKKPKPAPELNDTTNL
ncbi:MAG: DUF2167 domain-containing protein [Formosimonas sp.]